MMVHGQIPDNNAYLTMIKKLPYSEKEDYCYLY